MKIAGCSAVISGGASGLGAAAARRLARAGASVVLLDLPRAEEAGAALAAELGGGAVFVPGDVTKWDDVGVAVQTARELAPLRIAVAAAGIATSGSLVGPRSDRGELFAQTVAVNLGGTYALIAHAASAMSEQAQTDGERGVVVCTASIAAYEGQVGQVAYAASKSGVAGLTLPAARELARHQIRVVTIAPGLFETPMFAGVADEVRASVGAQVPHPSRLGNPDEYAGLVQHVIENSMLNGEVIRLDGAIRMGPR
ncbi:SDR family NAD(P)-dependent oxidoreductase [Rhodococcus koreensis]|uniref:SDR family NAD(P)-dependent oxidoreductase n=1 Tax=Rhodococcus koreensis TaxID=99653 RepID=UPI001980988C|nr:SDR family NAD(P)-dependent oxidoreductase [Rhodococcus koreensis]QSE78316.1 SDR family NAD(P)-dependent oxidoreductase [Rhodococcus koreensis]